MPGKANPEIVGVVAGVLLVLLGLGLALGPALAGADMMRYGYGLAVIGVFVAGVGLAVALVFRSRALTWAQFVAGEKLLAHWHYEPEEWQRYATAQYGRDRASRLTLLGVTAAWMAVIGVAFYLMDPEGGRWVLIGLAGLLVLLAALAVGLPWLHYRHDRAGPGEVRIAANGVWMNGRLYLWDRQGGRLARASWVEGDPPLLELQVSYPARIGGAVEPLHVPVPRSQEQAGRQVLEQLQEVQSARRRG